MAANVIWEISLVGLSLSLFTLILKLTQQKKHISDILLCFWLIVLSIPLIHTMIEHYGLDTTQLRQYTNPTFSLLQGPFLYFYVLMLIRERLAFKWNYLWHLAPFVWLYSLFSMISNSKPMIPDPIQIPLMTNTSGENLEFLKPLIIHFAAINTFIFIIYSLFTFRLLLKHQQNITLFFAKNDNQISLKWVYSLPISFILLVLINVVNQNDIWGIPKISPMILHQLSFLSFIILLSFFGVKQHPIFRSDEQPVRRPQQPREEVEATKLDLSDKIETLPSVHKRGALGEDDSNREIVERMQRYMENQKPYLDSDFSVYHLAEALKIPRRTLSHVLSTSLSKNFFQYVNDYRIKEVKERLNDFEEKPSTLLDIAYQSGFNSKSSFNSLFKKHCHVTPSQYRSMVQEKTRLK